MEERLRRWRLLLGSEESLPDLESDRDQRADAALSALYNHAKKGGLGESHPNITRWLGDIRELFPSSVVAVMQRDAIEKLNLQQLLLEKETLRAVQPDPDLAMTLVNLSHRLPAASREAARSVVREIVRQISDRIRLPLEDRLRQRQRGRTRRKNASGTLDWDRTIRSNLRHMQKDGKLLIETQVVRPKGTQAIKHIVLAMDQSGSMGASLLYAGIYASVLASLPALNVQMFAFSTEIADLTSLLDDPVELLFASRLDGGTDIAQALTYADQIIDRPGDTVFVIITDLYEGGNERAMVQQFHHLVNRGVRTVCLLTLDDDGTPSFNHHAAQELAQLGIPSFACTPDAFPDLLASSLNNLHQIV